MPGIRLKSIIYNLETIPTNATIHKIKKNILHTFPCNRKSGITGRTLTKHYKKISNISDGIFITPQNNGGPLPTISDRNIFYITFSGIVNDVTSGLGFNEWRFEIVLS